MVVQSHQSPQYAIDSDRVSVDCKTQPLAVSRSQVVAQDWHQAFTTVGTTVARTLLDQGPDTSRGVERN